MVSDLYSSRARTEQLIAIARVVLAACSLVAIWLDPTTPSKHADTAYTLLTVYLGYSLLLALWAWYAIAPLERIGAVVHALDVLSFTLFIYFTEGPTSPFFVYFVFAVIAGALRWQWRGAVWTGLAVLAIFLSMGLYVHFGLHEVAIDLHRFIIRGVYLGVVAALLAYVTAYEQGLRGEMSNLAAWPRGTPQDIEDLIRQELRHLVRVYGASRVVMIWEEAEEPWVYVASHTPTRRFDWKGSRQGPSTRSWQSRWPIGTFCARTSRRRRRPSSIRRRPGRSGGEVHRFIRNYSHASGPAACWRFTLLPSICAAESSCLTSEPSPPIC